MVSRIRLGNSRVEDAGGEYDQDGRALLDLVLDVVAHKPSGVRDRRQKRVLISFGMAMMAALRSAPRIRSKVHLSDLNQLDDVQFERIIQGLHYMRRVRFRQREDSQKQAH